MAEKPKMPNPNLTIYMADGAVLEVQTLNKDLLLWDRTRARRKWPQADEARNIWMTFIAWAALKREGQITDMTVDQFEEQALSVAPTPDDDEDDQEEEGLGPTRKEAEPSS